MKFYKLLHQLSAAAIFLVISLSTVQPVIIGANILTKKESNGVIKRIILLIDTHFELNPEVHCVDPSPCNLKFITNLFENTSFSNNTEILCEGLDISTDLSFVPEYMSESMPFAALNSGIDAFSPIKVFGYTTETYPLLATLIEQYSFDNNLDNAELKWQNVLNNTSVINIDPRTFFRWIDLQKYTSFPHKLLFDLGTYAQTEYAYKIINGINLFANKASDDNLKEIFLSISDFCKKSFNDWKKLFTYLVTNDFIDSCQRNNWLKEILIRKIDNILQEQYIPDLLEYKNILINQSINDLDKISTSDEIYNFIVQHCLIFISDSNELRKSIWNQNKVWNLAWSVEALALQRIMEKNTSAKTFIVGTGAEHSLNLCAYLSKLGFNELDSVGDPEWANKSVSFFQNISPKEWIHLGKKMSDFTIKWVNMSNEEIDKVLTSRA